MRSYGTARGLFSFLEFCTWCVVLLGIAAFIWGINHMDGFNQTLGAISTASGAMLTLLGLLCAAAVQAGRASVDTAELTQQMLSVAREHLEISRRSETKDGRQDDVAIADLMSKSVDFGTTQSASKDSAIAPFEGKEGGIEHSHARPNDAVQPKRNVQIEGESEVEPMVDPSLDSIEADAIPQKT